MEIFISVPYRGTILGALVVRTGVRFVAAHLGGTGLTSVVVSVWVSFIVARAAGLRAPPSPPVRSSGDVFGLPGGLAVTQVIVVPLFITVTC